MTKVFERVISALADVSALIIAFIVLAITGEVIMRHVFVRPLSWTVEVTEYLQLYIAFFAAAAVLKEGGHITLDLLSRGPQVGAKRFLRPIGNLLGVVATITMFFFSSITFCQAITAGTTVFKTLDVPRWLILLPLPVGFFLLAAGFLRRLFTFSRKA